MMTCNSSGQLHQRFALRTLLVILGINSRCPTWLMKKWQGCSWLHLWPGKAYCSGAHLHLYFSYTFVNFQCTDKKICLVSGLQPEIQLSSAQLEAWVSLTQVDICPFLQVWTSWKLNMYEVAGLPGSHLTSAGVLQVKYYCIRIPFSHLGDSNYL